MWAIENIWMTGDVGVDNLDSPSALCQKSKYVFWMLFEYLNEASHILFYINLRKMCEAYGFSIIQWPISFTVISQEIRQWIVEGKYALVSLWEFTGLPGLENSYIVLEESWELLASVPVIDTSEIIKED